LLCWSWVGSQNSRSHEFVVDHNNSRFDVLGVRNLLTVNSASVGALYWKRNGLLVAGVQINLNDCSFLPFVRDDGSMVWCSNGFEQVQRFQAD
jgi:hypothetical protein